MLAWHRFNNVSQPLVATVAFLAQAEKGMPTREATLRDDGETGTRVYLRFPDSGRAYVCSKKEVANLRRWFGYDLEQWTGKQVQIRPVVCVAIAGKEVRKPCVSAVSLCFVRDHIPVAIFQMKRPTVATHLRCVTQRLVFLNL